MEVVAVFNGLGNQMSQYAFYLAKKKHNPYCRAVFNPRLKHVHNGFELEKLFGIKLNNSFSDKIIAFFYGYIFRWYVRKILQFFNIRLITEPRNYDYISKFLEKNDSRSILFYFGGWHSEKYFNGIESEVRSLFRFPEVNDSPEFNRIYNLISTDTNSVSIHIRRGDYLEKNNGEMSPFDGVCTVDYYRNAIDAVKLKVCDPNFYVFSNDIDWCKNTFKGEKMIFVTCNSGEKSWRDMQLMSLCRHHINANSTFSWWAAWLSPYDDGIVIRPKYFLRGVETKDFYPEKWLVVE